MWSAANFLSIRAPISRDWKLWGPFNWYRASQVVLVIKNPPVNAGDIRDAGSIRGSGRSPGGGHGHPLQYSCLENPMERGAWWARVHGVTKNRTWPSDLACTAHSFNNPTHRKESDKICFSQIPQMGRMHKVSWGRDSPLPLLPRSITDQRSQAGGQKIQSRVVSTCYL